MAGHPHAPHLPGLEHAVNRYGNEMITVADDTPRLHLLGEEGHEGAVIGRLQPVAHRRPPGAQAGGTLLDDGGMRAAGVP